ncbi:MAG: hypothetical protein M3R48_00325 [Candidatus Dormibacteraeota bacterium]|nr:hypothetical protein [Candidatus Dormibacteraeota bacterium]
MSDDSSRANQGRLARAVLAALAVIGAFLIVLPMATGLPGKSAATANMMTAFRPVMSDAALAQGQADQQTMAAMAQQLNTGMIPGLAAQMHMTPQQLSAYLGTNFPAVGKGMTEFGTILPFFGNLQTTMQAQQANFQQADQIPTGYMGPTKMSVLFVIPGLLLLLVGSVGLLRPRSTRKMLAAGSAIGLVVVGGLLSVSMYGKATAADAMTSAFKPIFATQNVQQARAYTDTVKAMSTQFTQQALPGLATALHVTPVELTGMITKNFPAVATGVAQLPQIVQRMDGATGLIEGNVDNFNQSASIPWSPGSMIAMFWFMMVPGLLALALGAGALVFTQRRRTLVLPQPRRHSAAHI